MSVTVQHLGRPSSVGGLNSLSIHGLVGRIGTPITGTNLDFEVGDTTGWTQIHGGNADVATDFASGAVTPYEGTYLARAAATAAEPWWSQTITIDSSHEASIDAGTAEITLSAYILGFSGDVDRGSIMMEFLATDDSFLGSKISEAEDPTDWVKHSITQWVPQTTRKVKVSARGWKVAGTACSVFYGDFRITIFTKAAASELITSEEADHTLWTNTTGTLQTSGGCPYNTPQYMLNWSSSASGDSYREITIPSTLLTAVAAGTSEFEFDFQQVTYNNDDTGRAYIEFYDGVAAQTGSTSYSNGSKEEITNKG